MFREKDDCSFITSVKKSELSKETRIGTKFSNIPNNKYWQADNCRSFSLRISSVSNSDVLEKSEVQNSRI